MEVSVENTSELGRRVKISVPDAQIKEQIKVKMAKLGREVRLKGFRPGKVPSHVLEKKFGSSVRSEVVNALINDSLREAFTQQGLVPAGMPHIEALKAESGQNLEFTAAFEIFPDIKLASFADVEIEKRTVNITEQDVQNMMAKLQDQLANWNKVERPIKEDDKVAVDFARLMQGDDAVREEQKNVQMIVGAEGVLPGLSDRMIGKTVGEQIEGEFTYPQDWADAVAAGKIVTLWVTILSIEEKERLTKEMLAEKLAIEANDQEKLLETIKNKMEEELQTALHEELKEKVLEKLLEINPIELPRALIDQEKEAIRKEISSQRRMEIAKEDLDNEEVNTSARRRVELGLLLNEVIQKHNLKTDPQKVRAEIEKIARRFSQSPQVIEAYYRNNQLMHGIERMVLLEQAVNAILGEVKVKETEASFDEVMNSAEENN